MSVISGEDQFGATIEAANLDNDARPDLVMGRTLPDFDSLRVYWNDGSGVFGVVTTHSMGLNPEEIDLKDFDGDGKLDIAAVPVLEYNTSGTPTSPEKLTILKNAGNRSFLSPTTVTLSGRPFTFTSGDFDMDGHRDVALAVEILEVIDSSEVYRDSLLIYRNNGTMSFTKNASYPSDWGIIGLMSCDLVEGDGYPEIVMSTERLNEVCVLRNNGAGAFVNAFQWTVYHPWQGLANGDLNGDGELDFAVPRIGTDSLALFTNCSGPCFGDPNFLATPDQITTLAVNDIDRDGDKDVALVGYSMDRVTLMKNSGGGLFSQHLFLTAGNGPSAAVFGNANADGKIDLFVANALDDNFLVFLGDGLGGFGSASAFPAGNQPKAIAVQDLNLDGKSDVVVVNELSDDIAVLIGNGNGTFQSAIYYSAPDNPRDVSIADINGDNKQDIIVVSGSDVVPFVYVAMLKVLLNNGNGTFTPSSTYQRGGESFVSVSASDIDRDGDIDVFVASQFLVPGVAHGYVHVYENLGSGSLSVTSTIQLGSPFSDHFTPTGLASSDLTGDGYPEVIVSGPESVRLLRNIGGDLFLASTSSLSGTSADVAAADIDCECGKGPDLLVAGNPGGMPTLITMISCDAGYVTPGDLNDDGLITVLDVSLLINYVFRGAPPFCPEERADINCDGQATVLDVVALQDYVFGGQEAPCYECTP